MFIESHTLITPHVTSSLLPDAILIINIYTLSIIISIYYIDIIAQEATGSGNNNYQQAYGGGGIADDDDSPESILPHRRCQQ